MKSGLEQLKKAASRARKAKGPPVLSTSEARANFAVALETAQSDNAVIGFGRYGRTVAALVPVEAIYMLAGLGKLVDPATRKEIEEGAVAFSNSVPFRSAKAGQAAAAVKGKVARAPGKSPRSASKQRRAAPARKVAKNGKRAG